MRSIPVPTPENSIPKDLRHRLSAVFDYPEDESSREKAIALHRIDSEFAARGIDSSMDKVGRAVFHSLVKDVGQRATASEVAFVMLCQSVSAKSPSLETAWPIVSRAALENGRHLKFTTGGPMTADSVKPFKASDDEARIKSAFRKYRSIAHWMVASRLLPEEVALWKTSDGALMAFFSMAETVADKLSSHPHFDEWKLWRFQSLSGQPLRRCKLPLSTSDAHRIISGEGQTT